MKKIPLILAILALLANYALADNKPITLNKKKLAEIQSLLKTHGINVHITRGNKVFLKDDKDGYTSSIILLVRNVDTQKEGVYFLHYMENKLLKILWMEGNGVRTTGEKIIHNP